ncbi:ORF34L [Turbot reddish body iridovirus]|uniref:ORF34L n=1 Tax=Turbot reddish body iridovirus TaxID=273651 RepID=E2CTX9_ISKNV|nr:ORF34L [Turbot reddish body iridovirus]
MDVAALFDTLDGEAPVFGHYINEAANGHGVSYIRSILENCKFAHWYMTSVKMPLTGYTIVHLAASLLDYASVEYMCTELQADITDEYFNCQTDRVESAVDILMRHPDVNCDTAYDLCACVIGKRYNNNELYTNRALLEWPDEAVWRLVTDTYVVHACVYASINRPALCLRALFEKPTDLFVYDLDYSAMFYMIDNYYPQYDKYIAVCDMTRKVTAFGCSVLEAMVQHGSSPALLPRYYGMIVPEAVMMRLLNCVVSTPEEMVATNLLRVVRNMFTPVNMDIIVQCASIVTMYTDGTACANAITRYDYVQHTDILEHMTEVLDALLLRCDTYTGNVVAICDRPDMGIPRLETMARAMLHKYGIGKHHPLVI